MLIISFSSDCWGGHVLDKNLAQSSDFFNLIERGDNISTDHCCSIADLGVVGANIEIPAFTRRKTQLSRREVKLSKQPSLIRIYVERFISLMKSKYRINKWPLSICLPNHKGESS